MASKFDTSKLKPVQGGWDPSQLTAVEDEEIPYKSPPKPMGLEAVGEDVANLPGKALDYFMDIPQKAPEGWSQIFNKPGRAIKNLLAGGGEMGIGLLNAPHAGLKYLGEKGLIPDWLKNYNEKGLQIPFTNQHIPTHIGNLGVEEALGIDKPEPGDEIIRQMLMLAPIPKVAGKLPGIKSYANRAERLTQYGPLKRNLEELEASHSGATAEHGEAARKFDALKDFLEGQSGYETSNANRLEGKSKDISKKIQQLTGEAEKTPEHLRVSEEPVAPETTKLSLVEPVRPEKTNTLKLPKTEVNDRALKEAEAKVSEHAENTAEHAQKIEQHLGRGNVHTKRVARILNPILEKRANEIGEGYDKYQEGLKGESVVLSNPRSAKEIVGDINKRLKTGDTSSQEVVKLREELNNLGKDETMPADKFVSAYRSLRTMAQKTRSSAYGKSPQEFDRLTAAADSMDADVAKMEKVIDSGLGEENLKELRHLNKRWSTEVTPLYKNKFYQHMRANNVAPTNMIDQLMKEPYVRSTNPNKITGAQILDDIIKQNPEALKNIVGERFAHKPEAMHAWDEGANEYIQHMPDLQKLRSKHFESMQAETQSKLDLERAKHEHQIQKEAAAKKDLEQKEAAQEKNRQAKEEAQVATRQKKSAVEKENKAKKEEHEKKQKHYKITQEIKGLQERQSKLEEHIGSIRESSNNKNISLKKKLDLEARIAKTKKELAKIQEDIGIRRKILKGIGYTGATLLLGGTAYNKAKSIIGQ